MQKATFDDRKRRAINGFRGFLSFLTFIGTVAIASLLINHFIFQAYYVDGSSMSPTLHNDDRLIVDKISKTFDSLQGKVHIPARGDIVTFDSNLVDRSGNTEQLIKRVIGLPGETVIITGGKVTVRNPAAADGFDPDAQLGLQLGPTYSESTYQAVVPEGSVFVMGDNRGPNGSYDSRSFGPISIDRIQGRLALRIFPFDAWRTF